MKELSKELKLISPANNKAANSAKEKIDNLTKPIGSLGALEDIAIKLAGIHGGLKQVEYKKNIIIMCADNGVIGENVSNCPQEVKIGRASCRERV